MGRNELNRLKYLSGIISESVTVNEWFVREGSHIHDVAGINVFLDLVEEPLHQTDSVSSYKQWSDNDEWMKLQRELSPVVKELHDRLMSVDRILTDEEAEEIETVWYSGSDAYDDFLISDLRDIYLAQIEVIQYILGD